MEYLCMGAFLENLHPYGWYLEGLHTYESLEMGSREPLEDPGRKSFTYGCHLVLLQHHYGSIFIVFGMHNNGYVAETPAHTAPLGPSPMHIVSVRVGHSSFFLAEPSPTYYQQYVCTLDYITVCEMSIQMVIVFNGPTDLHWLYGREMQ